MSEGNIDLSQIIADTPYTKISDEYIIRGEIVFEDGEEVELDKDVALIFFSNPEDITPEEERILDDVFSQFNDGQKRFFAEVKIVYDIERVKEDITKYVDELLKIFR